MLQVSGEANRQRFRVDLGSGALLIKDPIDRGALCGLRSSCVMQLRVRD